MDQGASIPLHTHPIEEGFVVTEGAVTIQLGEETITATAGSVVRIPPGVPHALRNQAIDSARVLGAAAWNRADFFREATTYLEGVPRKE
jgi:quercetin dioxygenase-like cupin family protein